jgi:hypothetical protein
MVTQLVERADELQEKIFDLSNYYQIFETGVWASRLAEAEHAKLCAELSQIDEQLSQLLGLE